MTLGRNSSLPGNVGYYDQEAAIRWVHENIRNFGGDPNQITIMGQSAGGASVITQMTNPNLKNIVKRGIAQSGTNDMWPTRVSEEYAVSTAIEIGKILDCNT